MLASVWRDPAVSVASGAWWCVLGVLLWGLAALGAQEYTSRGRPWHENAVNDRPLAVLPKGGRGERRYVHRAAALVECRTARRRRVRRSKHCRRPGRATRGRITQCRRRGIPGRRRTALPPVDSHTPDSELYAYAFKTTPGAVTIIIDASTATVHPSGSRFRDSTTHLWHSAAALSAAAALLAALQGVAGPTRMAPAAAARTCPGANRARLHVHRPGEAVVYPADDPHGRRPMFRCRIPAAPATAPDRPREAVLYGGTPPWRSRGPGLHGRDRHNGRPRRPASVAYLHERRRTPAHGAGPG
ncbi:hypothetical protein ACU686_11135 [Yinghuangia aomiensis]